MYDCENCFLSPEQCICGKVDKFFKGNPNFAIFDLDVLYPIKKNKKTSEDFELDETDEDNE